MIWNKNPNPEIQSALAKKLQKFGCRARRAARGDAGRMDGEIQIQIGILCGILFLQI